MIEQVDVKERQRRPLPPPLIYRQRDLLAALSCSRQQIENMIREHDFPRSIPLSSRARGWLVSEVTAWLESRKVQRAHPGPRK